MSPMNTAARGNSQEVETGTMGALTLCLARFFPSQSSIGPTAQLSVQSEISAFFLGFCSQVFCHRIATIRATLAQHKTLTKGGRKISFKSQSLCAAALASLSATFAFVFLFCSRVNLAHDVWISGDSRNTQNKTKI